MNMLRRTLLLLVVGLLWAGPLLAERGPSTAEELAKALRLVTVLEQRPQSADAKDARKWLITWLTEVPDIEVKVCFESAGTDEQQKSLPPELKMHPMFGYAAHAIEHHGEDQTDPFEGYLAGVRSLLRTYESWKQASPRFKSRHLERLVKLDEKGDLEAFVRERVELCESLEGRRLHASPS